MSRRWRPSALPLCRCRSAWPNRVWDGAARLHRRWRRRRWRSARAARPSIRRQRNLTSSRSAARIPAAEAASARSTSGGRNFAGRVAMTKRLPGLSGNRSSSASADFCSLRRGARGEFHSDQKCLFGTVLACRPGPVSIPDFVPSERRDNFNPLRSCPRGPELWLPQLLVRGSV